VAIKVLDPSTLTDENYRAFVQEGKLMLCVLMMILVRYLCRNTFDSFCSIIFDAWLSLFSSSLTCSKLCSKKHHHFVQVHAVCIAKESPAIVMEYAEKGTLVQVLTQGPPLSLNTEFSLVIGIARGVLNELRKVIRNCK
jgi:serine/threonine protein kinase